jgi:hypothetical protein
MMEVVIFEVWDTLGQIGQAGYLFLGLIFVTLSHLNDDIEIQLIKINIGANCYRKHCKASSENL